MFSGYINSQVFYWIRQFSISHFAISLDPHSLIFTTWIHPSTSGCGEGLFWNYFLWTTGGLQIKGKSGKVQQEEGKVKKKKKHTSQDKQIGEGTLHEKVLTWMIPERIVTVAATITLCSSNDEWLLIELVEEFIAPALATEVNLTTVVPTIILRTGNGPN